ncbi:Uncharacterised protein [Vibrio cholerae]|nr:Uncharacterised protein [Vibrio cholerae]
MVFGSIPIVSKLALIAWICALSSSNLKAL